MEKLLTVATHNLTIFQGEKVLIKGDMASGKTTLLKDIAKQLPADTYDMLSQTLNANFIPGTVSENLAFNLENDAIDKAIIGEAILKTAALYDLIQVLSTDIEELSTYQKQVLALAQILIHPTPTLLLDEPLFLPSEFVGTLIVTGDFDPDLFDHVITLTELTPDIDYLEHYQTFEQQINPDKAILSVTSLIKDLSFTIYQGEKIMITAPPCAPIGDMLAGFSETQGEIYFYYEDITHQTLDKRGRKLGYVMANPQDMIFVNKVRDAKISDDILALCGLSSLQHTKLSTLSYRQQKLFNTACILMQHTPIVIIDQPETAYLTDIMSYLDQQGVTVILISDQALLLPLMDRQVTI